MNDQLRRIECHGCGAEVQLTLERGYEGPDVHCKACGILISSHSDAIQIAGARMTLEEAIPIAMRYTFAEILEIARRSYDSGVATPEEMDAMCAFNVLRAAGLPCHAPDRIQ